MMMNGSVQNQYVQDAMPDFEVIKSFMEDDGRGQLQDPDIANIREIHPRGEERDPAFRKRFARGPFNHQWPRHMNLDETYRTPSLFTWRC